MRCRRVFFDIDDTFSFYEYYAQNLLLFKSLAKHSDSLGSVYLDTEPSSCFYYRCGIPVLIAAMPFNEICKNLVGSKFLGTAGSTILYVFFSCHAAKILYFFDKAKIYLIKCIGVTICLAHD